MRRHRLFCLLFTGAALAACAARNPPRTTRHAESVIGRPNILVIVADDLGRADLGVFGSEIATPHLDALARSGLSFHEFHTSPASARTRATLLTGVDHHLALEAPEAGGAGFLSRRVVTAASLLRESGYHTYMAGKWQLGRAPDQLPSARGFERTFALLDGAASHWDDELGVEPGRPHASYVADGKPTHLPLGAYSTALFTDQIIDWLGEGRSDGKPFFALLSFTAPAAPLQAPDEWLAGVRGRYDAGYDVLREARFTRQRELGLVPDSAAVFPRLPGVPAWDELSDEEQRVEAREMETYAAMVECLDHHVGRLVEHLQAVGEYDRTFIVFLSDNGPSSAEPSDLAAEGSGAWRAESFDASYEQMGRRGSFTTYGAAWAQVSAVPGRLFAGYPSEGGVRTPLIIRGSGVGSPGRRSQALAHVMDLAPTFLDLAGVRHSRSFDGRPVEPIQGRSMLRLLTALDVRLRPAEAALGWELDGRRALRQGSWKLLWIEEPHGAGTWQLYDLARDPAELVDLSAEQPRRVQEMAALWDAYAERNGVPRDAALPAPVQ